MSTLYWDGAKGVEMVEMEILQHGSTRLGKGGLSMCRPSLHDVNNYKSSVIPSMTEQRTSTQSKACYLGISLELIHHEKISC